MQKFLLAATAVASIALFAPMSEVEGQSNNEPAVAPAPRTVNLTAEQRFIIKEIVLKDLNVPKARAGPSRHLMLEVGRMTRGCSIRQDRELAW